MERRRHDLWYLARAVPFLLVAGLAWPVLSLRAWLQRRKLEPAYRSCSAESLVRDDAGFVVQYARRFGAGDPQLAPSESFSLDEVEHARWSTFTVSGGGYDNDAAHERLDLELVGKRRIVVVAPRPIDEHALPGFDPLLGLLVALGKCNHRTHDLGTFETSAAAPLIFAISGVPLWAAVGALVWWLRR